MKMNAHLTPEQIAQIPITERAPEIGQLLLGLREHLVTDGRSRRLDEDGACEMLTEWLDSLGYQIDPNGSGGAAWVRRPRWVGSDLQALSARRGPHQPAGRQPGRQAEEVPPPALQLFALLGALQKLAGAWEGPQGRGGEVYDECALQLRRVLAGEDPR